MAPQQQQQQQQQQSQQQPQPPTQPPTTARDELTRLAAYLEFRTRDLRASLSTSLGFAPDPPNPPNPAASASSPPAPSEDPDPDEDLFAPIGHPSEAWTEVSAYALDVPEVRSEPCPPLSIRENDG